MFQTPGMPGYPVSRRKKRGVKPRRGIHEGISQPAVNHDQPAPRR